MMQSVLFRFCRLGLGLAPKLKIVMLTRILRGDQEVYLRWSELVSEFGGYLSPI